MLSILHDVTERRRQEETLRLAQKMESLGVLAGGVAHDFNNLLAVMLGHTSLALAKLPAHSNVREHVQKAVAAAERAAGLTRQMLAYSGRGHFQIRPTDLNRLVIENVSLLGAAVPKQVSLLCRSDEDLPRIAADPSQVQQVIMNLILNASEAIGNAAGHGDGHHAPARGRRGRPRSAPAHGRAAVPRPLRRSSWCATTARAWTRRRGRGSSSPSSPPRPPAGAWASRRPRASCAATGAASWSRARPARAPRSRCCSRATAEESAAPPEAAPGSVKGLVLVVDDEGAVLQMIADVLEGAGLSWIACSDGDAAVRLVQERSADISLVLLDLSMPGLSGEATLEALRLIRPDLPVLLSSGYAEAEATSRFVGHGLAGFIQKPYRPEALVAAVRPRPRPGGQILNQRIPPRLG